jgi:drug/metabolite transporter (DMT)-like permease
MGEFATPAAASPRTQRLAITALCLGAVATAVNPVFVRLSDLDPMASAFHRMAWALPVMWAWMRLERRAAPGTATPKGRRETWLLVLCGLFFAADLAALHGAIRLTTVANAILFLNAQPVYVVLGAWLLFGERVSGAFLAGVAVALVGGWVLVADRAELGPGRLAGDALGVLAGLCYGGYILTASRLRARLGSATINAWTCFVAAPLMLATALAAGQDIVPADARGWALMIGLGVVSQACGQGFIVWGLAHLSAGFSSVALLSAPVAAALFAWLLLAEPLGAVQLAGMAVVLLGIGMARRAGGETR